MKIQRIAQLRTAEQFRNHVASLGLDLECDETVASGPHAPLAQPLHHRQRLVGNRFAVLPMEGWDGTSDGRPSELTRRRWARFGQSGAKLIWGGEAVAVRPDGRANPNQLMILESTLADLAELRDILVREHRSHFERTDDLLVGLQLTHSGRFARPLDKKRLAPRTLYRHPLLDAKFAISSDDVILTDDEIDELIAHFVAAAARAQQAGFDFVDIKHCHGYLGHEFLSALDRPGRFGGSLENRTRFLREIVTGIRDAAPGLEVGVRLSLFDFMPFQPGEDGTGTPATFVDATGYAYAFGGDGSGLGIDLREPIQLMDLFAELDIRLVCMTAGSPYYNPHIQRPALFPPSDGYQPPEDPLVGVARQINATAAIKAQRPDFLYVGTGYSYLQEWLPNVAQHVVRSGQVDSVGLGRMILAYPEMAADVLAGRPLQRKRICRTFSDCTTAPRNGMVSGCYPLDEFYKNMPEYQVLVALKGGEQE
jgi:NADPH2 dehydrogenase